MRKYNLNEIAHKTLRSIVILFRCNFQNQKYLPNLTLDTSGNSTF